jgi:hypothetical protein
MGAGDLGGIGIDSEGAAPGGADVDSDEAGTRGEVRVAREKTVFLATSH